MQPDPARRILIVEDDQAIAEGVARVLTQASMPCVTAGSIEEAEQALAAGPFLAAIIDLTLPDGDGLALTRRLKEHSSLGILILSARGETTERIVGLELGADDFLPKPFEPRELLARMRALMRRLDGSQRSGPLPGVAPAAAVAPAPVYAFDGLVMDVQRRALSDGGGREVALTTAEFNLLLALVERAGRVLTREQLMDLAQGPHTAAFDRSIDVLVGRVRRKIQEAVGLDGLIKTIRNAGYLLTSRVERR